MRLDGNTVPRRLRLPATIFDNVCQSWYLAAMTMNINLTPQLEELVRQKVASGLYNSASEVVREALRLMGKQDELRAVKLERLRKDIREGLESGTAIPWDPEKVRRDGYSLLHSGHGSKQRK